MDNINCVYNNNINNVVSIIGEISGVFWLQLQERERVDTVVDKGDRVYTSRESGIVNSF